jgi:hypothetical protein
VSAAALAEALQREAEALRKGRLELLPGLQQEKEALAERLADASAPALEEIAALAASNAELLAVALDACRSARDRLETARSAPARIGYTAEGMALTHGNNSKKMRW